MPSIEANQAPPPAYLPPLDACLNGRARITSWTAAAECLSHIDVARRSHALRSFLHDDLCVQALADSTRSTRAPNAQAKSDFETRTAAVNVGQAGAGNVDIKQLKEDTIWLAKHAEVDEITALRTYIVDLQDQPRQRIAAALIEEESSKSSRSLDPSASVLAMSFADKSGNGSHENATPPFSQQLRRAGLMRTWYKEQQGLLAVRALLTKVNLASLDADRMITEVAEQEEEGPDQWIESLHIQLCREADPKQEYPDPATAALSQALNTLHARLRSSDKSNTTLLEFLGFQWEIEAKGHLLDEMLGLLRCAFTLLNTATRPTSPPVIASWCTTLSETGFGTRSMTSDPRHQLNIDRIQSLVSILMIQILDTGAAISSLETNALANDPASSYVFDPNCVETISRSMASAASLDASFVAPAMICWAAIGRELYMRAESTDVDTADRHDYLSSTSKPSRSNPDLATQRCVEAWRAYSVIADLSTNAASQFAHLALSEFDIFSEVGKLAVSSEDTLGLQIFDPSVDLLIRRVLLDLLHNACIMSTYSAAEVEAVVAVIEGNQSHEDNTDHLRVKQILANEVLEDQYLSERILGQARIRYPYELTPLLVICQRLCVNTLVDDNGTPTLIEFLTHVPTFTDLVPETFVGYESTRELEQENLFVLREEMPIFHALEPPKGSFRFTHSNALSLFNDAASLSIPRGIEGVALAKEKRAIIAWDYEHSALLYMGRWLYEASMGRPPQESRNNPSNGVCSDVILLLARLVDMTSGQTAVQVVEKVLSDASDALPQHTDIVSVISDVFEKVLSSSLRQDDLDSVSLLASCLAFFGATVKRLPGRVWPILARQGLFDVDDNNNKLLVMVNTVERVMGAPNVFNNLLDLISALVNDIVSNAVVRAGMTKRSRNRFEDIPFVDAGVPNKQLTQMMSSSSRPILAILRTLMDTGSEEMSPKLKIGTKSVRLLHRLVRLAYDSGDLSAPFLTGIHSAAALIVEFFLRNSSSPSNISLLLILCEPLAMAPADLVDESILFTFEESAETAMSFLVTLLQVNEAHGSSHATINRMIQAVPIFVRIYSAYFSLRELVLSLLKVLAHAAGKVKTLSIFSQLEPKIAKETILLLSDIQDCTENQAFLKASWKFFSSCISNKQTWFASYLLTGRTPSRSPEPKSEQSAVTAPTGSSVLDMALNTLACAQDLEDAVSVAMLQFVVDALNFWPWSITKIQNSPQFLGRMVDQLDNLQWEATSNTSEEYCARAWQTAGASLVCELFAMYLHGMRTMGNTSELQEWASRIPLLDQPGFKDPTYNRNLHQHLKNNVEKKFAGLTLEDLRRRYPVTEYGSAFYYNSSYANDLLTSSAAWTSGSTNTGFRHEFALLNENLSLVDAQRLMIAKWKLLCLELVEVVSEDYKLHKKLAYVAHECLNANRESQESDSVFIDLRILRLDLATTIVQRLVELRYAGQAMQSLLGAAWNVTRAGKPDFDSAFMGEESECYRLCVKLLLLCLRPYTYTDMLTSGNNESTPVEGLPTEHPSLNSISTSRAGSIMQEIAVEVVAKGFRSLAAQLHEDQTSVHPHDFSLLTSILRSLLQVHGVESTGLYAQLALNLADFNLGRFAIALYSWSNEIKTFGDDPIYGDLSIGFLVELSALPSVAELLATDGILSRLNTASLMLAFQRPSGTSAYDEPRRAHKIWTRGILPLVLNVLVAVGAPFAAEAATFLNNYAPQLALASNALDSKGAPTHRDPTIGCITLNAACEAHTLALLSVSLDQYRANDDANVPELDWDRAAVKDDVETWIQGTRAFLRERIIPVNEKEVSLSRMKPLGGLGICECKSRLEELVLKELKGASLVLNRDS